MTRHPLHPSADDVVAKLRGLSSWRAEIQLVNDALRRGDFEWLRDLHTALLPWSLGADVALRALSATIVERLALTPGLGAAYLTMALCRARPDQVRSAASRLAFVHPVDVFLRSLEAAQSPDDDLLACWLHEHLLRKGDLPHGPALRRLQLRLIAAEHPLTALPLRLNALETGVAEWMPRYHPNGGMSFENAYPNSEFGESLPEGNDVGAQLRRARAPAREDLTTAVSGWLTASNGKALSGVFVAPTHSLDRSVLNATGYACFPAGEAYFTTAESAFAELFSAATNGGAYDGRLYGAYGRLAAWRTMAALVGCKAATGVRAVEQRAARCTWVAFRGPFNHLVGWDLGLAVLRPSGHLAVLAATDTD